MPPGLRLIREHVTRGICTPWSVFQRYSETGLCAEESLVESKNVYVPCAVHASIPSLFPKRQHPSDLPGTSLKSSIYQRAQPAKVLPCLCSHVFVLYSVRRVSNVLWCSHV